MSRFVLLCLFWFRCGCLQHHHSCWRHPCSQMTHGAHVWNALLHGRCVCGYMDFRGVPTSVLSSRFQLLDGLNVERSETVVGNACPLCRASLFFTDRVSQTSVPPPTRRSSFMEVVCEQKCCTSCFEPVLVDGTEHQKFVWWRLRRHRYISWRFDWLNRFGNFCSLCCACLFFADVSGGESHKHDFVPHPMSAQLTKKRSTRSGQMSTICLFVTFSAWQ